MNAEKDLFAGVAHHAAASQGEQHVSALVDAVCHAGKRDLLPQDGIVSCKFLHFQKTIFLLLLFLLVNCHHCTMFLIFEIGSLFKELVTIYSNSTLIAKILFALSFLSVIVYSSDIFYILKYYGI